MIWIRFRRVQIGIWPLRWYVRDVRAELPPGSGYRKIFARWFVVGPVEVRVFTPNPASESGHHA